MLGFWVLMICIGILFGSVRCLRRAFVGMAVRLMLGALR